MIVSYEFISFKEWPQVKKQDALSIKLISLHSKTLFILRLFLSNTYTSFWYNSTELFSSANCSFNNCKFELTKLSSRATVSFSFLLLVALWIIHNRLVKKKPNPLLDYQFLNINEEEFCSKPRCNGIGDPKTPNEFDKWELCYYL